MSATSDRDRLMGYVDVWWQAVNDFTALLETLPEADWHRPTDLPGWDVRAVASHVAHLETVLATGEEESAEVGEPEHVTGPMGLYTEIGVVNRRERSADELIIEIREAATARHTALLADPPTEAAARPARIFGGAPWSWERLLRNRPLDVWMHEQDVRRAVARPGGMDTPAAQHTADYLTETLGFVLGKRVGAPAGTSVVLEVAGSPPAAYEVDQTGRGVPLTALPATPAARVAMGREPFVVLAGGRRTAEQVAAEHGPPRMEGDRELGRRVVERLATTP